MRIELIAYIEEAFIGNNSVITVGATNETKARIERLWECSTAEQGALKEWLSKSDTEMVFSE